MTTAINNHRALLTEQLSCIFKYVNDQRVHRTKFNTFKPLVVDDNTAIYYSHKEFINGRSEASIVVDIENRIFNFIQRYHFGVLLGLEVLVSGDGDNTAKRSFEFYVNDHIEDEALIKELFIDFEYALSLVTENVATNLSLLG